MARIFSKINKEIRYTCFDTKGFYVTKLKNDSGINMGSALYAKLSASCKAAARKKFDVYPSAYANMWASKQQKKGKC